MRILAEIWANKLGFSVSIATEYKNVLRLFIARRGQVTKMRSDNGTNFIGAERELKRALNEWNLSQIQSFREILIGDLIHQLDHILVVCWRDL